MTFGYGDTSESRQSTKAGASAHKISHPFVTYLPWLQVSKSTLESPNRPSQKSLLTVPSSSSLPFTGLSSRLDRASSTPDTTHNVVSTPVSLLTSPRRPLLFATNR